MARYLLHRHRISKVYFTIKMKNTTELRNKFVIFVVIKHYLIPLHIRKFRDVQIWCLSVEDYLGI